MHSVGIATGHDAGALPITADEELARGCAARLLISASTERNVEVLARRLHEGGPRAHCPFLQLWAVDFPVFYRLNIIHLTAVDGPLSLTPDYGAEDADVLEASAPNLPR